MESKIILEKLDRLEKLIEHSTKEILNVEELINYTGFARSYIYKLVHKNIIPYYKPNGKYLFFKKSDIDEWLLSNRSISNSELKQKALEHTFKNPKK